MLKPLPEVASDQEATDLYERVLAAQAAAQNNALATAPSGFERLDNSSQTAPCEWRPVSMLPARLVNRKQLNRRASLNVYRGRMFIGLKGGGFERDWERGVFKQTEQRVALIMNGTAAIIVSYVYGGGDTWQYHLVPQQGLELSDIWAAEIEKEGTLLYSGMVEPHLDTRPVQGNICFVTYQGVLVSWMAEHAPGVSPFGKFLVDGETVFAGSRELYFQGPHRRLDVDLKSRLAEGAIVTVSGHDVATDQRFERSPVGVFHSQGNYFLLANPAIVDDALQLTLRSHKLEDGRPLALAAAVGRRLETLCAVDEADHPQFSYLSGRNSLRLPLSTLKAHDEISIMEGEERVGCLPPVADLLDWAHRMGATAAPPGPVGAQRPSEVQSLAPSLS